MTTTPTSAYAMTLQEAERLLRAIEHQLASVQDEARRAELVALGTKLAAWLDRRRLTGGF